MLYTISNNQRKVVEDGKNNFFNHAISLRFLKYMLGLSGSWFSLAVLGKTKYPLMNEAVITMLKFWHKITNMDNSTFLTQAIEIQMNNIDSMEWAATIKFLLRIVNLQQLLDNTEHISTPLRKGTNKNCANNLWHFGKMEGMGRSATIQNSDINSSWNHI